MTGRHEHANPHGAAPLASTDAPDIVSAAPATPAPRAATPFDTLRRKLHEIFALPPMSAEELAEFRGAQSDSRDNLVVPAVVMAVLMIASFAGWDLLRDRGHFGMTSLVRLAGGAVVLAMLVVVRFVWRLSFRAQALTMYCAAYGLQAAVGWALGRDAPLQLPGLMIVMFCGIVVLPRALDALVNLPLGALSVPLVLSPAPTSAEVVYVTAHFAAAAALVFAGAALVERMSAQSFSYRRRLQHEASTDGLTGLHNRREFETGITREIERAKRMNLPLTLALIDIDHFKRINDTWGHDAGDEVLRQTASTMQSGVRISDLISRIGGEEFALVMLGTGPPGATVVLERLRAAVAAQRVRSARGSIACSVSIGAADWTPGDVDWHALYKRADAALYEAKGGGRNRVFQAD